MKWTPKMFYMKRLKEPFKVLYISSKSVVCKIMSKKKKKLVYPSKYTVYAGCENILLKCDVVRKESRRRTEREREREQWEGWTDGSLSKCYSLQSSKSTLCFESQKHRAPVLPALCLSSISLPLSPYPSISSTPPCFSLLRFHFAVSHLPHLIRALKDI